MKPFKNVSSLSLGRIISDETSKDVSTSSLVPPGAAEVGGDVECSLLMISLEPVSSSPSDRSEKNGFYQVKDLQMPFPLIFYIFYIIESSLTILKAYSPPSAKDICFERYPLFCWVLLEFMTASSLA